MYQQIRILHFYIYYMISLEKLINKFFVNFCDEMEFKLFDIVKGSEKNLVPHGTST